MNFQQTGGPPKQPSPDVNLKMAIMTTVAFVITIGITLFLAGLLAYPAWELVKIGWNVWS